MKDHVQSVIEQIGQVLEKGGYLPRQVTFSADVRTKTHSDIDVNKINFEPWKTAEYWEARMPEGLLEQFPCLYFMVEEMLEKNKDNSPLKELEARRVWKYVDEDIQTLQVDELSQKYCNEEMKTIMKEYHKEEYKNEIEYRIKQLEEQLKLHLHQKEIKITVGTPENYVEMIEEEIEKLKAELNPYVQRTN